jgi:hypothetical protein
MCIRAPSLVVSPHTQRSIASSSSTIWAYIFFLRLPNKFRNYFLLMSRVFLSIRIKSKLTRFSVKRTEGLKHLCIRFREVHAFGMEPPVTFVASDHEDGLFIWLLTGAEQLNFDLLCHPGSGLFGIVEVTFCIFSFPRAMS